jgi:hypothetical protein
MARTLVERMVGAAMLDVSVYEEVEADEGATGQAAIVVMLVAAAGAVGASRGGGGLVAGAIVGSLLQWLLWSGLTYFIGTRFFAGTATYGELLRTLGFAMTPGVLSVLGIIPGVGGLIQVAVAIWTLVAGIIAIRQALDFDTGKAILTAVISWAVVFAFIMTMLFLVLTLFLGIGLAVGGGG